MVVRLVCLHLTSLYKQQEAEPNKLLYDSLSFPNVYLQRKYHFAQNDDLQKKSGTVRQSSLLHIGKYNRHK